MVQFSKLKLSGFKSFVDHTELWIEPGLTGIVGPNGCGKSNLVEALRWVMGEGSAKRMRGGGMEDMIFSGSASRPARNIAEVSLNLDNRERVAPSQFNEHEDLEVTRRIEREHGSTYRVNGREVRARDVQLLFADSATGSHSPALVSQGRIGAIINAKPSERRSLLEEAAGISGLHTRRHEAELRLRAAETNLDRLDDVIGALEGQLQGLKKQARQARRFRRVSEQIRQNEAIVLHLEAEAAHHALEAARSDLAAAEEKVAAMAKAAAERATIQAETAAALPHLRQEEAEAAAALQRLVIEREALESEVQRLADAKAQAEQRLAQTSVDRERDESLAEDARTAVTRLERERDELLAREAAQDEALATADRERDEAAAAAAAKEAELTALNQAIAGAEAKAASLQHRLEELKGRLARLAKHIEETSAEKESLEETRQDLKEVAAAGNALHEAEQAVEASREALERREAAAATAKETESAARNTLQQAEAAVGRLEAEVAALSGLLRSDGDESHRPVVDSIEVEPGFETALGIALGDDLAASTETEAPIRWSALQTETSAPSLPDGARPLSDFVRGPDALKRRLDQIGVVEDESVGDRLKTALACGQRLVTRAGALWRWDGFIVTAGSPTAAATRLQHRNRLSEIEGALPEARARVEAATAEFERAQDGVRAAGEAERQSREAQRQMLGQLSQSRQAHAKVSEAATAAKSRIAALSEALELLAADARETQAETERCQSELADLPDLSGERERLASLQADTGAAQARLAERQAARSQLKREAEARAQRLSQIEEELKSWQGRAAAADRHLAELEERRADLTREIEALETKPAELTERREALASRIAAAEGKRKAAADTLAEGETAQSTADRLLKAAEADLATAREQRIRTEAAVTQSGSVVTAVRHRVRERLDCELEAVLEVAELDPGQELPEKEEVEARLARLVRERENAGPVNLRAEAESEELEQRIQGMQTEREDLLAAIARLRQGISSLNREGRERLLAAFNLVDQHFSELFVRLFGGGRAHLKLLESDDPLEAGLEIMASPPGKRLQVMSLLSGGEQALTALALLFGVFLTNPAPICVLDEVDAPLDDANVDRFCRLIEELASAGTTRFLIITHHRMTMARMDRLYGVTMAERGVSQLVSVDLQGAQSLRETA